MCRIAAYLGAPQSLQTFLLDPDHSLYEQSWAPRELRDAHLNADGYGVAWYAQSGRAESYVQSVAAWNDPNLPALGRSLRSHCWLGNMRSATAGLAVHVINTQPFVAGPLAITHNGYVAGYDRSRAAVLSALPADIAADVRGTTDSEALFALVRREAATKPLADAVADAVTALLALTGTDDALLSLVVSDGEQLVVMRHAVGGDCPSLYLCRDHPDFGTSWLVASEAFDTRGDWQTVTPHTLHVLTADDHQERHL